MTDWIVDLDHPIGLVGGAQVAPELLNILQSLTNAFVAADGGADHLRRADLRPLKILGDLDSISRDARADFAPQLVHIAEQDTTDLEKVLTRVNAPVLVGAGFLGGRLDHTFAALNCLARYPAKPLILIKGTDCCFRCPDAGLRMQLPIGTDFAVLPMTELFATSRGLQWEMDGLALRPDGFVSSSNRTAAPEVDIRVTGSAIITLPLAQLTAAIAAVRAK